MAEKTWTPARRVTIHDVAQQSGVSRQTVSRAMNDMDGISADTKERVLSAARELGYHPSRFGRGLVRHDHRTLGLVIGNLTNPYYPELASAVVSAAADHGWTVLLLDCSSAEDQRTVFGTVAEQVDALIGYVHLSGQELDVLLPGVPVVWIDESGPADAPSAVRFDPSAGCSAAVDHLLERGARRTVVIDPSPVGETSPRVRTFVRALKRRGYDAPVVHSPGDQIEAGVQAAEQIIASMPDTDAILCFNDFIAFGVLKVLHRAGIAVPGRVRVIGIDGLAAGTYVTPELTTMALDIAAVASAAVEIALGRLDGSIDAGSRSARRKVRHRLIVRGST